MKPWGPETKQEFQGCINGLEIRINDLLQLTHLNKNVIKPTMKE